MSATNKPFSEYDTNQIFKKSYNESGTLGVDGFLAGRIGNKMVRTISTTSVANDTEQYDFFENQTTLLYSLKVIYTDGTRTELLSAERIA